MKLAELNPEWINSGTASTMPRRGIGVMFDCPCGKCDDRHRVFVALSNPIDGGGSIRDKDEPVWVRSGEEFSELTLTPSINRPISIGGCGWHGWVRNGIVINL